MRTSKRTRDEKRQAQREANRRFRERHPDRVKAAQEKYDLSRVEARKKYYQKNKKHMLALGKANRDANPERERARSKAKSRRYLAQGFCHNCPTPRMPNSTTYCEKHWFAQRAIGMVKNMKGLHHPASYTVEMGQRLKEKLEKQHYRCPYTGKLLVPGVNASLDHIIPKTQRPDLAGDIDNTEWVDQTVNRMKTDLSRDEFLALIQEILEYTHGERAFT